MRPSPARPPFSRRAILGGAAIGSAALTSGLAAGCSADLSDLDPRATPPTPTTTASLQEPAATDRDADVRTLDSVYAEVLSVAALVEAVSESHSRLQPLLAPALAMHHAHAEALVGAALETPRAPAPATRSPRRVGSALRSVRTTEEALQTRLFDAAVAARSGTFARLLGSMAAAVGQQLAALPNSVARVGDGS